MSSRDVHSLALLIWGFRPWLWRHVILYIGTNKNVRIQRQRSPHVLSRRSLGSSSNLGIRPWLWMPVILYIGTKKRPNTGLTGRPMSSRDVHSVALLILGFRPQLWMPAILHSGTNKNDRMQSQRASNELSRRSFGSSFKFGIAAMALKACDTVHGKQTKKTSEYRANGRPTSSRDVHSVALLILGFRPWLWRLVLLYIGTNKTTEYRAKVSPYELSKRSFGSSFNLGDFGHGFAEM